ncbi:hypothetical protein Btru_021205, partial [Bulinus truncatus]
MCDREVVLKVWVKTTGGGCVTEQWTRVWVKTTGGGPMTTDSGSERWMAKRKNVYTTDDTALRWDSTNMPPHLTAKTIKTRKKPPPYWWRSALGIDDLQGSAVSFVETSADPLVSEEREPLLCHTSSTGGLDPHFQNHCSVTHPPSVVSSHTFGTTALSHILHRWSLPALSEPLLCHTSSTGGLDPHFQNHCCVTHPPPVVSSRTFRTTALSHILHRWSRPALSEPLLCHTSSTGGLDPHFQNHCSVTHPPPVVSTRTFRTIALSHIGGLVPHFRNHCSVTHPPSVVSTRTFRTTALSHILHRWSRPALSEPLLCHTSSTGGLDPHFQNHCFVTHRWSRPTLSEPLLCHTSSIGGLYPHFQNHCSVTHPPPVVSTSTFRTTALSHILHRWSRPALSEPLLCHTSVVSSHTFGTTALSHILHRWSLPALSEPLLCHTSSTGGLDQHFQNHCSVTHPPPVVSTRTFRTIALSHIGGLVPHFRNHCSVTHPPSVVSTRTFRTTALSHILHRWSRPALSEPLLCHTSSTGGLDPHFQNHCFVTHRLSRQSNAPQLQPCQSLNVKSGDIRTATGFSANTKNPQ